MTLSCKGFYDALTEREVTFFAGVPDSLLKDICAYITAQTPGERHVITANEGSAIALASGHHFATGAVPLVYLQNSGLGNVVNPVTSLADPDVYATPMLLMIGWRGEPGKKDEPQHMKMGRCTTPLLDAIEVPHLVVPDEEVAAAAMLDKAVAMAKERGGPVALVVPKGTFDGYKLASEGEPPYPMSRERAIEVFCDHVPADAVTVGATGKPSRELFFSRERKGQRQEADFLTVGAMGHCSQIALGIAMEKPQRPIVCLDGDGSVIMHMGGLATIGARKPANYFHVLLNNAAHDSVGGQPTVGFDIDFAAIAAGCGYRKTWVATNEDELNAALPEFFGAEGPVLLEIRIKTGARKDLRRPTNTTHARSASFKAVLAE